jgi:uncharacterized protein involved in exopolysaccharide biosynthesis
LFDISDKASRVLDKLKKLFHLQDKEQSDEFRLNKAIQDLKESIEVQAVRDTGLFTIRVSDYNPIMAAKIANVVSRTYVIFDLEQQLAELQMKFGEKHPVVSQLRDNVSEMVHNLTGERLPNVEAMGTASVKIIEQASVPLKPSGLPKLMTLLMAIAIGLFTGLALAFILHRFYTEEEFT